MINYLKKNSKFKIKAMKLMKREIYFILFLLFNFAFLKGDKDKNLRKLPELSDDIVILHVNDVHCGLNNTVGYDGFVLYRDELKKKYKNIISVDVGDHIQGGSIGAISNGEAIIKLMNKVEFNVSILGNHEFDYGVEQLFKLGENISSRYICSNFYYRKNKTRVYKPYKIIEIANKTIGFVGVLTPLTFSKTYLSTIRDGNNEPIYDLLSGNNGKDLYEEAQKNIDDLKAQNVDYVILLTHLGMTVEEYTSDGLLSNLKNVDAVLDGHTHKIYNTTTKDKDNKNIPIAQTGTKLGTIGQLIIKSDGSFDSKIIYEVPEPDDKTDALNLTRDDQPRWVSKEINEYINDIYDEHSKELNQLVGHSDFSLIIRPENTTDSHYVYCRYRECTLGDLISDAFKDVNKAEIAILNGGSIRNNMLKGNITSGQVIDILPWYNSLVAKKVTGQMLYDALEFGVRNLPNSAGGFPQISGINFDVNIGVKSTVNTDADGMFLNVTGERRVSNVKVNGENLNLTRLYNISLDNFIGSGGDGYSMFTNLVPYYESIYTDTDSLKYYIKEGLKGEIPNEYRELQGRINIYNYSTSLPARYLLGFDNYKFYENIISYLVHIRLANCFNESVKNVTMRVNLVNNKLRLLQEEKTVNCIRQGEKDLNIYIFNCSIGVDGPVSKISYVQNSIKLNGETDLNLSSSETSKKMGENIQNQITNFFDRENCVLTNCTAYNIKDSLIIEGENDGTNLVSKNCNLLFVQDDEMKNVSCEISAIDGDSNKFRIVCEPNFKVSSDLSNNSFVIINDLNKAVTLSFDKDGIPQENSTGTNATDSPRTDDPNSTETGFTNSYFKKFKKSSGGGLSAGTIIAILLPLVAAIAVVTALIFLFKYKSNPTPPIESGCRIPTTSSPDIRV